MLPGWINRILVKRNINKIIRTVMVKVERTLQKNPGLTVEDTLKIIDKKMGIFFPNDKSETMDLKSLFTMIVWKSYRHARLSDPESSSPTHREWVTSLVEEYLHDDQLNKEYRRKTLLRPVPIAIGIAAVMISSMAAWSFYSRSLTGFAGEAHRKYYIAVEQNDVFKYRGYSSGEHQKIAVINESIYHEGDLLDEKDGYVLKHIQPQYIVIQNKMNRNEFAVYLH